MVLKLERRFFASEFESPFESYVSARELSARWHV